MNIINIGTVLVFGALILIFFRIRRKAGAVANAMNSGTVPGTGNGSGTTANNIVAGSSNTAIISGAVPYQNILHWNNQPLAKGLKFITKAANGSRNNIISTKGYKELNAQLEPVFIANGYNRDPYSEWGITDNEGYWHNNFIDEYYLKGESLALKDVGFQTNYGSTASGYEEYLGEATGRYAGNFIEIQQRPTTKYPNGITLFFDYTTIKTL